MANNISEQRADLGQIHTDSLTLPPRLELFPYNYQGFFSVMDIFFKIHVCACNIFV